MIKDYASKQVHCKAVQMEEFPFVHGESGMYYSYQGLVFNSRFPPSKGDWIVKEDGHEPSCVSDFQFRKKYEV